MCVTVTVLFLSTSRVEKLSLLAAIVSKVFSKLNVTGFLMSLFIQDANLQTGEQVVSDA